MNHEIPSAYELANWQVDVSIKQVLVIHTLAVHPLHLCKGIGQCLIDFAKDYAKGIGVISIRLDVYEKNFPAIRLYEKNSFVYADTVDLGLSSFGLDSFKLYERLV